MFLQKNNLSKVIKFQIYKIKILHFAYMFVQLLLYRFLDTMSLALKVLSPTVAQAKINRHIYQSFLFLLPEDKSI